MSARRWGGLVALLALQLLSACTSLPPATPTIAREHIGYYQAEGRFALSARQGEQNAQQASGRLRWTHYATNTDELLLMNPLGHGIAELSIEPDHSRLLADNGREYLATEPETLLREVLGELGSQLPLRALPRWLLGRGDVRQRDIHGRPLRIEENGWHIDYSYDDDTPDAPPARLNLRHQDHAAQIDLRLRIESWRTEP